MKNILLKIWEKSIIEPTLKNILLKIWEKKYYWTNAHVLKNILLKIWEKKLCWRIFYWRFEKKSIIEPTHICWRIFYWRFKKKILLNQRTYVEEYILSLTITKSKKLLGHRHGTGPDWTLNPIQHCYGRQLLALAHNWYIKKPLLQAFNSSKNFPKMIILEFVIEHIEKDVAKLLNITY